MLDELANLMQGVAWSMKQNLSFLLGWLGVLWGIHVVNTALGLRLNVLGIYPRTWHGIFGIIFAPFLHGGFGHLFINSLMLFCLASLLLLSGIEAFYTISIMIIVLCGLLTWLFARRAFHVGASGLVMGYWGYLLITGYTQGDILALLVSGVCFYFFAEMAGNLVPSGPQVSWESHLFGFLAGVGTSFLYASMQVA